MIYRFLLLADEVDDFIREIQINSDATFLDLHNAILDATDYDRNQLYSFFICDEDWEKETEITQIEMDTSSEVDNFVMDSTPLDEFLSEEHQKLLYVFDTLGDRVFFIELREIITGKPALKGAVCTKSVGSPPKQLLDFDALSPGIVSDIDEEFYGDDAYDDEELENFNDDTFYDDRY